MELSEIQSAMRAARNLAKGYLPNTFFKQPALIQKPLDVDRELGRVSTMALKKAQNGNGIKLIEEIMTEIIKKDAKIGNPKLPTTPQEMQKHKELEASLYKCFDFLHIYFKPNPEHFNFLIEFHSASKLRNMDNAILVLKNACNLGMSQEMLQACSVLIRRCHPDSSGPASLKHIKEIFEIMEFYEIDPDESILATAIDAYVKLGNLGEAKSIFDDLEVVYNVKPNIVMYGSIIQGFSNMNNLEGALDIYLRMIAKGMQPNSRTILKMLTVVCRKAVEVYSSGGANNRFKGITLNELMDQLCDGLELIDDLDDEFREKSITIVLSALSQSSNPSALRKCIDLFEKTKDDKEIMLDFSKNPEQHSVILSQALKAIVSLHGMTEDLDLRKSLEHKADSIFAEMKSSGLLWDENAVRSYGLLYLGWRSSPIKLGSVSEAFSIFRQYDVNLRYYGIDVLSVSVDGVGSALRADLLLDALSRSSGVPLID